jgi:phospholipid/cholesterol/gamma-HCH transport system substrate-binding protein
METRANYVMIGSITVIVLAMAMLFAIWLARVSFTREFAVYDVVFDGPARGIGAGTEVRFNGIRVGEVRDLFMDPANETNVVARVRIGATWPVRANSEVRLEPIGLTGLNLIQISSAEGGGGTLLRRRMGAAPPRIAAKAGALDEILASSEDITRNATEALEGARDMMTKENAERFARILRDLETVSKALSAERGAINATARAADELRVAASQFTAASREFEALAKEGRTTVASIGAAAQSVDAASNAAAVGTLPELTAASQDMRRLAVTLDRVASNVERSSTLRSVGEQKPVVRVQP